MKEDNPQSVCQLVSSSEESHLSVHGILKTHKYHPFKLKLLHEVNKNDFDRHLQFCEQIK